ncbi:hypothetical protein COI14_12945, partial [Neisseria meningitidis]
DNHFSCRTATTSAFTPSAEIAFVRLDRALKNLIGSQGQMMVDAPNLPIFRFTPYFDNRLQHTGQVCPMGKYRHNLKRQYSYIYQ